jgi:predicted N-acyltransferase
VNRPIGPIRCQGYDSVAAVEPDAWDALVPEGNFYLSHGWLRAMGRARAPRSECLVVRAGSGEPLGALPLYLLTEPDGGLLDPAALLGTAAGRPVAAGRLFPFLLGGARMGYSSGVLLASWLSPDERRRVGAALLNGMAARAAAWGARAHGFLYLNERGLADLRPLLPDFGYVPFLQSLEVRLPLVGDGFGGYLGALPGERRRTIRKELTAFDASGLRIVRTALPGQERTVAPLLANLQRRYGHPADPAALAASFALAAEEVGPKSVLFLLRGDGRTVGFCLCYRWRGRLFARAAGFDYAYPGLRGAYFPLAFYEPLRYAAEHGLREVHLGIESFEAKVHRGGRLWPLWSAVRAAGVTEGLGPALLAGGRERRMDFERRLRRPVQGDLSLLEAS